MNKKEVSDIAKELGRRGGKQTLKNRGLSHYTKMARARWDKLSKTQKQKELKKSLNSIPLF
jgi:hypothetical protein